MEFINDHQCGHLPLHLQHSSLDDHHIKRIHLIKTLLAKNPYRKNLAKEKEYNILFLVY